MGIVYLPVTCLIFEPMKAKQFSIGIYRIDLLRSVVFSDAGENSVEPKILQVLLLLAENQGEVVTHKEIMSQVWPNVEVVPNALQRCIAQLRKALGDNAKQQSIIATHPRIGYSLVAEVRWHDPRETLANKTQTQHHLANTEETKQAQIDNQITYANKIKKWLLLVVIFIALLFLLALNWQTPPTTKYTKIATQTQSDQHESHPIYSNDGTYIVFNRHVDLCTGNLWAKNTASGKEIKLTENIGIYGRHSFNTDGSQLVFSAQAHCQTLQPNKKTCWNIATIDFANALTAPQAPQLRYECQTKLLETPKALTNNQYAFLQLQNGRYSLIHYDDRSKKATTLYALNNRRIYYFDYDAINQRFAVISQENAKDFIDILAIDGSVISSNEIQRLPTMSYYQLFEANFISGEDYLLVSSYSDPHLLSLDGKLSPIEVPENHIIEIYKQTDKDTLLAIRGVFDLDIAELSLHQPNEHTTTAFNQQHLPYLSFARTTSSESNPRYQPNGDIIAFDSNRSGSHQLWLWQQNQATQLTFDKNSRVIDNFVWSPNGKQLAYVLNDQITLVDLNGKVTRLPSNLPVFSVLTWYNKNQLLVTIKTNNTLNLYRFDVTTQQFINLNIAGVKQAWLEKNTLIYINEEKQIWQAQFNDLDNSKQLLPDMFGKSSTVENGDIYHVEPSTRTLIKYNIDTKQHTKLFTLKEKAWWIEDIKADKLLVSQTIAVKKEVITLSR